MDSVRFSKCLAAGDLVAITQEPWRRPGGVKEESRRSRGGAVEEQRSLFLCQLFSEVRSPDWPDTNEVQHVTVHSVPSVDVLCSYYSLRSFQVLKYQSLALPWSESPTPYSIFFNSAANLLCIIRSKLTRVKLHFHFSNLTVFWTIVAINNF